MKKHILLIEKTREGYLDFMNALESMRIDCKVTYTNEYEHAFQIMEFLVPDCIFMKINVNDESSMQYVKRIRNLGALRQVKIVVYDDEVTGDMIKESMMQGADYCIDRPLSYADLNNLLKDVLNLN